MRLIHAIISLFQETWAEFQKDDGPQMSAALTYYTVFSLFPLLILLIAVLGFVLQADLVFIRELLAIPPSQSPQDVLLNVVQANFSPAVRNQIETILNELSGQAATASIIGIGTLLFAASNLFNQLNLIFNKIWGVRQQDEQGGFVRTIITFITQRLAAFLMLILVGVLLLLSLVGSVVVRILNTFLEGFPIIGEASGPLLGIVFSLLLDTFIFILLFLFLPPVRMRLRDVWIGAFLTAFLWGIIKQLLGTFLSSPAYINPYGVLSSIFVLMLWIFISAQILLLGAEFTEVYSRRHGSRAKVTQPAHAEPKPPPAPAT